MRDVIQIFTGMLGVIGFALLFHVRKEKLVAVASGGALSWAVYLIAVQFHGEVAFGLFASTVTVALLAEVLARVMKTPVTILLVPMLIPLMPGGDLYYTTSYLVRGQMDDCIARLELLVQSAGAIAFGILCVTCLFQVITRLGWKIKRKK